MAQSSQWKTAEREVAVLLGGSRTGPRGYGLPDVVLDGSPLAPEVKYQGKLSLKWADVEQAKTNMVNAGKSRWALFLREGKTGKRVVVLDYEYFSELYHLNQIGNQTKDIS